MKVFLFSLVRNESIVSFVSDWLATTWSPEPERLCFGFEKMLPFSRVRGAVRYAPVVGSDGEDPPRGGTAVGKSLPKLSAMLQDLRKPSVGDSFADCFEADTSACCGFPNGNP